MIDLSILALIISGIGTGIVALVGLLKNIRVFHSCCCDSECVQPQPVNESTTHSVNMEQKPKKKKHKKTKQSMINENVIEY